MEQQVGFKRQKRGYKPLRVENLVPFHQIHHTRHPTDPYFKLQWYLVSGRLSPRHSFLPSFLLSYDYEDEEDCRFYTTKKKIKNDVTECLQICSTVPLSVQLFLYSIVTPPQHFLYSDVPMFNRFPIQLYPCPTALLFIHLFPRSAVPLFICTFLPLSVFQRSSVRLRGCLSLLSLALETVADIKVMN